MNIQTTIKKSIQEALKALDISVNEIFLEHPVDSKNGDYSTNVAMAEAKKLGMNPRELAEKIVEELNKNTIPNVEKIEIAGAGFINFYLTRNFFTESVKSISINDSFGKTNLLEGEKVMVEYTDPNPFKEFHIGHLMANTIGESIARIVEWNGAEVKRACYQGDKGIHVASTIWALLKDNLNDFDVKALGQAYAKGATAYKNDPEVKNEIDQLNTKIYEGSDENISKLYEKGRTISLEYFETLYKKLGTKFDFYFFEGQTGIRGKEIVMEFLKKGIFEVSDGAIVFKGENYNPSLHTRVFINSKGIPTYEAKDLGNALLKYETYPYTRSIIITGNEVNDYFRVMLEAMNQTYPQLAAHTTHLSHGMLRLPTGKMSSRTGDVITAESLLADIEDKVKEIVQNSGRTGDEKVTQKVAVAALKYSILKQATGKDIIFDFDKSVSFDGDSGPYLQYSYARACSIIDKANEQGISKEVDASPENTGEIEKLLYRFPEVIESALTDYAPQHIVTYLIEVSRAFNSYYSEHKIVDSADPTSSYKVALTMAFSIVLKNGLSVLGIQTPSTM